MKSLRKVFLIVLCTTLVNKGSYADSTVCLWATGYCLASAIATHLFADYIAQVNRFDKPYTNCRILMHGQQKTMESLRGEIAYLENLLESHESRISENGESITQLKAKYSFCPIVTLETVDKQKKISRQ